MAGAIRTRHDGCQRQPWVRPPEEPGHELHRDDLRCWLPRGGLEQVSDPRREVSVGVAAHQGDGVGGPPAPGRAPVVRVVRPEPLEHWHSGARGNRRGPGALPGRRSRAPRAGACGDVRDDHRFRGAQPPRADQRPRGSGLGPSSSCRSSAPGPTAQSRRWPLAGEPADPARGVPDPRVRSVADPAHARRGERDLHDGAQARLVALGMNLRAAERLMPTSPQAALALVAEARETSSRALTDLRDLVRGIHPPVLADRGLADAIRALALDTPLRTSLDIDFPGRLDAPVESALYFAVAEVLANAVKHAGARAVEIRMQHREDVLRIAVTDDGAGGADPAK